MYLGLAGDMGSAAEGRQGAKGESFHRSTATDPWQPLPRRALRLRLLVRPGRPPAVRVGGRGASTSRKQPE